MHHRNTHIKRFGPRCGVGRDGKAEQEAGETPGQTSGTKKPPFDVYQAVTDQILELLDQGVVPWRNPIRGAGGGWPMSLSTGKPYRGLNVFMLAVTAMLKGYENPWWVTFNQAKERGGSVKKGEKSTLVTFWKKLEPDPPRRPAQEARRAVVGRPQGEVRLQGVPRLQRQGAVRERGGAGRTARRVDRLRTDGRSREDRQGLSSPCTDDRAGRHGRQLQLSARPGDASRSPSGSTAEPSTTRRSSTSWPTARASRHVSTAASRKTRRRSAAATTPRKNWSRRWGRRSSVPSPASATRPSPAPPATSQDGSRSSRATPSSSSRRPARRRRRPTSSSACDGTKPGTAPPPSPPPPPTRTRRQRPQEARTATNLLPMHTTPTGTKHPPPAAQESPKQAPMGLHDVFPLPTARRGRGRSHRRRGRQGPTPQGPARRVRQGVPLPPRLPRPHGRRPGQGRSSRHADQAPPRREQRRTWPRSSASTVRNSTVCSWSTPTSSAARPRRPSKSTPAARCRRFAPHRHATEILRSCDDRVTGTLLRSWTRLMSVEDDEGDLSPPGTGGLTRPTTDAVGLRR